MALTPAALAEPAARTTRRLEHVLGAERARWRAVHPDLDEAVAAFEALVLGSGKRLRPAFCSWAHVGAGGSAADPLLVDVCAALELLHAFALAHDDVMDGADTRRGQPTIHVRFGERHATAGWRGDPARFGDAAAILLGDLGHVLADVLVAHVDLATRALWNELRLEVNVGQYLDVLGAAQRSTDLDLARAIVRYKSGRYSVERPLQLGASLAGRPDLVDGLVAFGAPLGEAFQLRDDVLGVFGDAAVTGKPVGDDLREGKATLLVALAHQRADPVQRAVLDRIGAPLDRDEVEQIQSVLVDTGALADLEARIDTLTDQALVALDDLTLAGDAGHALAELARFASQRSH